MAEEIYKKIEEVIDDTYIRIGKVSKNELHFKLQHRLVRLAKEFEYSGMAEYPVYINGELKGFVDVVWLDENETPFICIEIDAKRKNWSIKKLNAIDAAYRFWLCYAQGEYKSLLNMLDNYDSNKKIFLIYRQFETKRHHSKYTTKDYYTQWEKWIILQESLDRNHLVYHEEYLKHQKKIKKTKVQKKIVSPDEITDIIAKLRSKYPKGNNDKNEYIWVIQIDEEKITVKTTFSAYHFFIKEYKNKLCVKIFPSRALNKVIGGFRYKG